VVRDRADDDASTFEDGHSMGDALPRLSDFQRAAPLELGAVKLCRAIAAGKGDLMSAHAWAQSRWPGSAAAEILKTAMNAGTLSTASTLAPYRLLSTEFLQAVRPLSVVSRLDGARRVPFRSKVARSTQATSVGWVGEGAPKPVSEGAFDQATLETYKLSGVVGVSHELSRSSSPAAEGIIRADLTASAAQFVDQRFLDPSRASSSANPASITYGVTATTSTGSTALLIAADLKTVVDQLIAGGSDLANAVWIMSAKAAVKLSMKMSTTGSPAFPDITAKGGTLLGLPVLTSQNAPGSVSGGHQIVLLDASQVLLADDGVTFDVSDQAALQMDSAPSSSASNMYSLWQFDMIGIRMERIISWLPARATGVSAYLDGLAI
jgi:HK97 family phage major capsid protein